MPKVLGLELTLEDLNFGRHDNPRACGYIGLSDSKSEFTNWGPTGILAIGIPPQPTSIAKGILEIGTMLPGL